MPAPDSLPADQLAVLRLLIARGRSYPQIAAALKLDEVVVRQRATAALSTLAGADASARLGEDERALLTDAVVGAGTGDAEPLLDRSADARAWQRAAREGLRAAGLPATQAAEQAPAPAPAPEDLSGPAPSRTGGAILLGLIAALLVLGILWQAGVFDSGESRPTATPPATTGTTTGMRVLQQVNLLPPDGSTSTAKGAANIAEQDGQRAIAVVGQGLQASSFYALWMQKDGRWRRLGFFPAVRPSGPDKGRLSGYVAGIPADTLSYDRLVVSRERTKAPKAPAEIVLTGRIAR